MKTPILFAAALSMVALGSNAWADHHKAPTALGAGAAHLAAAQSSSAEAQTPYVLRHDPTGAPMCFDAAGAKAPLASCEAQAEAEVAAIEHSVALDPSGAPMCFTAAGSKAPLSACVDVLGARDAGFAPQLAAR